MLGEYKKHAKNLIALKSVSSDASLKEDCKKTAEYLSDLLASYGFEPRLIEGYGNPVVYASFVVDPSRETALIYGHYEVQDAQKEDGWDTDPYDMNEKNNKLTIDEFYDDVEEIIDIAEIPFDLEEYTKNTGAKAVLTEREYDFYLQTGLRPSLTVTGMYGGYIKEGHKTIIPSSATAKLNFRLVKNQNPKKIGEIVKKHLEKKMQAYVDYDITIDEYALPNKTTADNRYVKKAVEVLEQVFGSKVYYRYVGGTEPVLMYFQNFLGRPIVSVPFANEDGAMHGINENFDIANIEKGIEFSENFFGKS